MDPFKYREIVGLFSARLPDSGDADQIPDRVMLNGYGTLRPNIRGTSVVFTEAGEFAVPRTRQVTFVDGELMVEVVDGESSILQPLFLEVTVDERANQEWSWTLTFDSLTIGEWDEEISHPALSFPVEDGDGPLELSTVATTVTRTANFVSRGAPGAGLQEITAADGEIVFSWDNGRTTAIGVPDAVPGPTGDKGDPGAKGDSGDVRFEGINPGITVRTDDVLIGDRAVPASNSSTVMHEVADPEWAWAVTDEAGQIALGVRADGTVAGVDTLDTTPYDVVLMVGQSNMRGQGRPYIDRDFPTGVDQYPAGGPAIIPAEEPLSHNDPNSIIEWTGMGVEFARRYRQEHPNRRLLLVPAARGATAFTSTSGGHWDWTQPGLGDDLAAAAIQQTKDALAAAGPSARLAGILWHQGEGDLGIWEQYGQKLDGLMTHFRTELGVPDLPVVVGQMSMDRYQAVGRVGVDAAHQQTPARLPYSAFAPSPSGIHNYGDEIHFSTRGYDILGGRFYEGLQRARFNIPGVGPVGPENLRATRVGGAVSVSWDPAWARVTEYSIEWRGSDGVWSTTDVDQPLSVGLSATVPAEAVEVRTRSVNDAGTSVYVYAPVVHTDVPTPYESGLRDIAALVTAGVPQWARLMRSGSSVELYINNWNGADVPANETILTLPDGFRPAFTQRITSSHSSGYAYVDTAGRVRHSTAVPGSIIISGKWMTVEAPPASEPGTAA